MPVEVISVPQQHAAIKATTTLNSLEALVSRHFTGHQAWMDRVTQDLSRRPEGTLSQDELRQNGLLVMEVAGYGFDSMVGHLGRHKSHKWKRPPTHPMHVLGSVIYTAKLNDKSYWRKASLLESWRRDGVLEAHPELEEGIWGVPLQVKNGGVLFDIEDPRQIQELRESAIRRMKMDKAKPICLPDSELNGKLAAIPFPGRVADTMSRRAFENEILPELQNATGGLLDPRPIFAAF